jgi:transposase
MPREWFDFRIPRSLASEMSAALREFLDQVLAQVDRLSVEVAELRLENQQLRSENRQLRQENAELREQLRGAKTPQNSSLPPSTQHPHAKPTQPKSSSGKKPGGQPGHPKHERPLIPPEQCQEIVSLVPSQCRRCQRELSGMDPAPLRHQVWEVPEIKPVVTEYQRHRLVCAGCGETTCASLPAGVPTCQAGPRLIALSALLMAHFRQSKRRTALFLQGVLNQPCSAAWVVKLQQWATAALRPSYDELVAALPNEPLLGGDETPSKEANRKVWLWTFVAQKFTVFSLRPSREATAIRELLGTTFAGIVSCDRAKMYWRIQRLQWCWAHLKRDFQALIDDPDGEIQLHGRELMSQTEKLFELWSYCRDGTLSRAELKLRMQPVRKELEILLVDGSQSKLARLVPICRELCEHRDRLWNYLDVEGLEPTNNHSERALRHAVIWRKLSFGTQSAAGSRFVETMLSVIETCRQQKRNLLSYVTEAIHAYLAGKQGPSLLTKA